MPLLGTVQSSLLYSGRAVFKFSPMNIDFGYMEQIQNPSHCLAPVGLLGIGTAVVVIDLQFLRSAASQRS